MLRMASEIFNYSFPKLKSSFQFVTLERYTDSAWTEHQLFQGNLQPLFAEEVEDDFSAVGVDAVLEEVDALPGAKDEAAVEDGDGELDLREGGLQVGGHVVEALVVVEVGPVWWRNVGGDVVEPGEDVALHGGVGVLLDEERGGGVAAEDGEEAGVQLLVGDPVVECRCELVEGFAAGGDREMVG
jgi:hypothetical protein